MRGPIRLKLGSASVTTLGFGKQVIAFLSNAPYNTDDLEPAIIDEAVSAAKELGVELMLVDAHNSIGGENGEQPKITKDDWRKVFSDSKEAPRRSSRSGWRTLQSCSSSTAPTSATEESPSLSSGSMIPSTR